MGGQLMTKPIVKIHNVETGEVIEREMNNEEFAQYEIDRLAFEAEQSKQSGGN
jgi:hypothetical protein